MINNEPPITGTSGGEEVHPADVQARVWVNIVMSLLAGLSVTMILVPVGLCFYWGILLIQHMVK